MSRVPLAQHNNASVTSPTKKGSPAGRKKRLRDAKIQQYFPTATQWLKITFPISLHWCAIPAWFHIAAKHQARDSVYSTHQFRNHNKYADVYWFIEFPTRTKANEWAREADVADPYSVEFIKSDPREFLGYHWDAEYPPLIREASREFTEFPKAFIDLRFQSGGLTVDEARQCVSTLEELGVDAYFNYPDGSLWIPVRIYTSKSDILATVDAICHQERVQRDYLSVEEYRDEPTMVSVTVESEGPCFQKHLSALFTDDCTGVDLVESEPLPTFVVTFHSLGHALRAVSAWRHHTF
ncbi:hypothetical protein M408DRAFT_318923 [Serendipita vermifera MAFF 305830]|uniref:Uncharacterized protein n=1 Tax=Serendipita vermifera MAFF 305830 TaxID=933852 RepID=A0A0C3AXY4_SERVB|nr:hypothetical protein M408DRAFT_318923 [Serendipita vermifera MAFF 305830]